MPLAQPSTACVPVLSQFSLTGKICLVTGGSRGIGLEVVNAFAEAGADVVFTYLTTSPNTAADIATAVAHKTGQRIKGVRTDTTDRAEIALVVKEVVESWGKVDVVVANAGVCRQIPSLEYTEDEFGADYAVNVYGVMWTAQAAGRVFKAQGHGNLIITASVSSVLVNVPQPQTSYNSSKAAAAHIGKNLAVEWVDFARVNCVSPGYVATNMTLSQPEEIRQKLDSAGTGQTDGRSGRAQGSVCVSGERCKQLCDCKATKDKGQFSLIVVNSLVNLKQETHFS